MPSALRDPEDEFELLGAKILRNRHRDQRASRRLEGEGWAVLRVGEHAIANDLEGVVGTILEALETPMVGSTVRIG